MPLKVFRLWCLACYDIKNYVHLTYVTVLSAALFITPSHHSFLHCILIDGESLERGMIKATWKHRVLLFCVILLSVFIVSLSIIEKKNDNSFKVFLDKKMSYSFWILNCGHVPMNRMNTFILLANVGIWYLRHWFIILSSLEFKRRWREAKNRNLMSL